MNVISVVRRCGQKDLHRMMNKLNDSGGGGRTSWNADVDRRIKLDGIEPVFTTT